MKLSMKSIAAAALLTAYGWRPHKCKPFCRATNSMA
jgi:hypothetical protein